MVVLAFASTRLLTGKGWDRGLWLRFGAALLVALASIFVINSETRPDPFPVVVGGCLFVAVLILVLIALTLSWRRLHRRGDQRVIAKTARDFGYMVLFGLFAAACLVGAVAFGIAAAQALASDVAYRTAPDCAARSASPCRSQLTAVVVRTREESPNGRHWIDLAIGGTTRTIEIETAYDVWDTLVPGEHVQVASWRGNITQVSRQRAGTMQTIDSPGWHLLIAGGLLGICLFLFVVSAAFGLLFWLIWRAGTRGIYVPDVA